MQSVQDSPSGSYSHTDTDPSAPAILAWMSRSYDSQVRAEVQRAIFMILRLLPRNVFCSGSSHQSIFDD